MKNARPTPRQVAVLACLAFTLIAAKKSFTIKTYPSGASISVNGQELGTSPVDYTARLKKAPVIRIVAKLEGYHEKEVVYYRGDRALKKRVLPIDLQEDLVWKATAFSEAANKWLRIQAHPEFSFERAWQALVSGVTSYYDSVEQLEPVSGYIRTAPKIRQFSSQQETFVVRTHFVCNKASSDPLIFRIKIVSERRTEENDITNHIDGWEPYPRIFREDKQLIAELGGLLGFGSS